MIRELYGYKREDLTESEWKRLEQVWLYGKMADSLLSDTAKDINRRRQKIRQSFVQDIIEGDD